jgi:uncharacterized protein YciI
MEIQTTPYFLVLLEKSEQYSSLDDFTENHIAYIDALIEKDKIFIGGDLIADSKKSRLIFTNIESAYLLNVRTLEEATQIAQKEPFSKNNVYKPIIIQWNLINE